MLPIQQPWHDSLVIGTAQFGQEYGSGSDRTSPSAATVAEILHSAHGFGIHTIDTARAYGRSEELIGRAHGGMPLRMVTKILPFDSTRPSSAAEISGHVHRSFAGSLRALRVDSVDTVLLHRSVDLETSGHTAVRALNMLVAEGRTRRWGVSVSTPQELVAALGHPDLKYVQLPFNLLDRRWLESCVQQMIVDRPDVHITARSVLLQGILVSTGADRWPKGTGYDSARAIRLLESLRAEFQQPGRFGIPIRYALAQPWIKSLVLGVRRREQLIELAAAVSAGPLEAHQVSRVDELIPPGPLQLVDPALWHHA